MKKNEVWFKKSLLLNPLIALYFFVAFIEIIAEFNNDYFFISYTKPLTIPLLIGIYLIAAKARDNNYLVALFLAFLASISLISDSLSALIIGSVFLLLSQLLYVVLVMKKIKYPGSTLMIIGSLPYVCICFVVGVLVHNKLQLEFYLFILQSILIVFFGGLSVGNYFTKNSKPNMQLFVGVSMLCLAQLLVVLKASSNNGKLGCLATIFFVLGNYIFCRFILGQEKRPKRYKIIK